MSESLEQSVPAPALSAAPAIPASHDLRLEEARAAAKPVRRLGPVWLPLVLGIASLGISIFAFGAGASGPAGTAAPVFSAHRVGTTLLALIAFAAAIAGVVLGARIAIHRSGWRSWTGTLSALACLPLVPMGGLVVLINAAGGFRRGRQLRSRGRLQLPALEPGAGWIAKSVEGDQFNSSGLRAVADQWRENGKTEHASVAAFARLSLDLLGLGAPAALLELVQRDGLDEIRHAELCFSLAKQLDGRDLSPAGFPAAARAKPRSRVRAFALAQVAIDSLFEGALHEGLSARVVAQLAKSCSDPRIQPVLAQIAEDEGRHAAHAWDILEWCLAEGGSPVRAALEGALRALPARMKTEQPIAARDGSWTRYGIHGEALEADAYAKTHAFVVRRAEALLD